MKIAGFVIGGAGLAGIVVGSVFGSMAFSDWSSAESACKLGSCTAQDYITAGSDKSNASSAGTISTIGFIAGGVALATGVTLIILAPKKSSTSVGVLPTLGPGGGGMLIGGTF
jgi:serine/threonine-protein kinase